MVREERSWFDRNWGWVLGCGCVTPILILAVLGVLGWFGISRLQGVMPNDEALAMVRGDAEVVEALGEPIEISGMNRQFSMHMEDGIRRVDVEVPLVGPSGEGRLYYSAERGNDDESDPWVFTRCEVEIAGTPQRIECLPDSSRSRI